MVVLALPLAAMRQLAISPFYSAALVAALLVSACGASAPTPTSPAATDPSGPSAAATPGPSSSSSGAPVIPGGGLERPDLAAVAVRVDTVADGFDQPVFVTGSGDSSGRLFVAEQPGRIRVVEGGSVAGTAFLDIADRVTAGGERGLLGLAFPPGFGPEQPRAWVHYSGDGGATTISELRLAPGGASILDPASERVILTEPQPYANHNGGWIGFDASEMLLIGLGDGGSGGDPQNRASDPGNLLGKLLRIDVLGAPAGSPYAIPADNPYAASGGRPEVFEIGLRNPFRASVDGATGDIWIGDVGQDSWEEVDVALAGAGGLDFGWRRWEGRRCYNPSTDCDPAGVTMPVTEYGHGEGCSVIGGVVYRGEAIPALRGAYLFSDYCSGTLWAIDAGLDAAQAPITLLETGSSISSIGLGDDGEVYLTDLPGGRVLKLVPAG